MEGLARKFVERQGGWGPGACRTGVHFRNRDVQAELADGRDVKEFSRLCIGPGVDQCSNVRIPRGDDAIKWGINLFERLQLFKPPYVGGTGFGPAFTALDC